MTRFALLVGLVALVAGDAPLAQRAEKANERIPAARPAIAAPNAVRAPLNHAARAGGRVVAVGDFGVVLLSDDDKTFRQAKTVPVQSTLTGVTFVDARRGWAVGHDGVIVATEDGGETWTLQHWDKERRSPLLSVWFLDARHGYAVGQFGQLLASADGGKTWNPVEPGNDDELADRHFNAVLGDARGNLWILGEEGLVLHSSDRGRTWTKSQTGKPASLWNGIVLADGTLVATGMRGHVFRSRDRGATWQQVETGVQEPLTGVTQLVDGSVVVVGFGGTVLTSRDGAVSFKVQVRPDRLPLSAVAPGEHGPVLFSMGGVVSNGAGK